MSDGAATATPPAAAPSAAPTETTALDLDRFLALPRVSGLALSPDGRRLVTAVATVAQDGKKFTTALWELDCAGERPPRRLTRSLTGETLAAFLPNGDLLFSSTRRDPDTAPPPEGADETAGLWLLPAGGGEAQRIAAPPGGIEQVAVARDAGTVALAVPTFPDTTSAEEDERRGTQRREAGVSARLFESFPIRYWDHYLGPRLRRLGAGALEGTAEQARLAVRDLTPQAGQQLEQTSMDISPDGATVVTSWRRGEWLYTDLVALDVASGERRVLASQDEHDHNDPACSPDGRWVVCVRTYRGRPEHQLRLTLWLVDLRNGQGRDLLEGSELWPLSPRWTADSSAVLFTADERGRCPVWRLDVSGDGLPGALTRLSAAGAFTDLCPSPDGATVYALLSTMTGPPRAVALDARANDQQPVELPTPGLPLEVPGRVEELWVRAGDGVAVHSWLTLPASASAEQPAPVVLFIHGGPLSSFTGWHWRWNTHVFASRGYAVLEVNPALSTGFGWSYIARGWGRWGEATQDDLLLALDDALQRPDLDATRVAAAGGSFGGYMANWLAGHSDRFRAIVSHASLWALDQFHGTCDLGPLLEEELGDIYKNPQRWEANSPHRSLAGIRTPMLVIHGELDARVPVAEALRLWTDLRRHGVPGRFLHFPDENHWVLKPQNARVWYETFLNFLDEHLLGKPWVRPALL